MNVCTDLERLQDILTAGQHLRKTGLLLCLHHRVHRLVYLDRRRESGRLDAADELLALTYARFEEIRVTDFATTLGKRRLTFVRLQGLRGIRVHGLFRKHKDDLVLLQKVNLRDILAIEDTFRAHGGIFRFSIADVNTSVRAEDKLTTPIC